MCDGKERCAKDISVIPYGDYCYTYMYKGLISVCPYWELIPNKPKQENGYCHYQGVGDWELGGAFGLLWDMVKCCSINKDEREFIDPT
jgi:hypothetical protein